MGDSTVVAVSRLLAVGTLAVLALVVLGTVLALATDARPLERPGPGFDPGRLAEDVAGLRPEGLLWLGVVLTVALPTVRVAVSLLGFAREGDRRAALVALGVLGVLAVSVTVAFATR